jgi:hypothetical protein
MKDNSHQNENMQQSSTLLQRIEQSKRVIARELSLRFQALSITTRKVILIFAGLFIAILCTNLVVGSHALSFDIGNVRLPITGQTWATDSTSSKTDSLHLKNH